MNQASRMESTGLPGRIQASAETAEELSTFGKQHWLQRREDKVTAKGIGDLVSYFVVIKATETSTSTMSATAADAQIQSSSTAISTLQRSIETLDEDEHD